MVFKFFFDHFCIIAIMHKSKLDREISSICVKQKFSVFEQKKTLKLS